MEAQRKSFLEKLMTGHKFPTTDEEIEWFDNWLKLNPDVDAEHKANAAKSDGSAYAKALKLILKRYLEANSLNNFGEFGLVYNKGQVKIHPIEINNEALTFKL